jgi:hypothetical protein
MLDDLVNFIKENGTDLNAAKEYVNKNYALEM